MTLKDYLRHFLRGAVLFGIIVYILWDRYRTETIEGLYLLAVCCVLMFPFAKQCIEQIALRYTCAEDWTTGIWGETSAKNGIYAMYYMLLFTIAIPLGASYVIYLVVSKKTARIRKTKKV